MRHPVLLFRLDDRAALYSCPMDREVTAVAVVVMSFRPLVGAKGLEARPALVVWMVLWPVV